MQVTVIVEKKDNVLYVKLNRPDLRNAFNQQMIADLTNIFKFSATKADLRAVVLSGEGPSFCAGADLEWMKSMAQFSAEDNRKDAEKMYDMFKAIHDCPVPVIARVHGHVMGGALGLVAVADLTVAAEATEFCFSEAKLGLAPAVISAFVKNKIDQASMARWFLTAQNFTSPEALRMNLIHAHAPDATVDEVVGKLLSGILQNGPQAVRETKKLIRQLSRPMDERALKTTVTELIAKLRVSAEGQEGLKSFFEKREPSWRRS